MKLFKGKPIKVINEIKKEIINLTKEIKIEDSDFENWGVEDIQYDINIYLNLINGIYQDLITGFIDKDTIIFTYNFNGELHYKRCGDDDSANK